MAKSKNSRYSPMEKGWKSFDFNSASPVNPCRALWAAVLLTALSDLMRERRYTKLTNMDSYRFFFSNREHFNFVCDAVGLSPDYVKEYAGKIIAREVDFVPYRYKYEGNK